MGLTLELVKLAKYKIWVNEITFAALSEIPESELYKPRETSFKNMVYTLNHIYVVDDIFKAHLTGQSHGYAQRNTKECPALLELCNKQKIMDLWYLEYLQSLGNEELQRNVSFEFVGGGEGNMSVSEIFFHLINHGTYHRGFVSNMMYQVPVIPPANDLTVFLRDFYHKA